MSQSGQAGRYAGGGGIIQTINGDTGSITGSTVTIYANNAATNAGSTVSFSNSGTVSTLNVTDTFRGNTFIGLECGNLAVLNSTNSTGFGYFCLSSITDATFVTAVGTAAGHALTTGSGNTFLGCSAGRFLVTGNSNILIGVDCGTLYTSSESNNIIISNTNGTAGESNVIRLGKQTGGVAPHTSCYIAGITGVTVSNAQLVTINSSTGQLGVTNGIVGSWTDVTSATQTLAVGNGYITDRGGGVTYTLPSTASLGDIIEIVGKAGLATITPNANQQILIGAASGSIGPGGTATATNAGDCITLRCITGGASSVWRAESYVGNWTLI